MTYWLLAIVVGALVAALQYARLRAPSGARRALLAALRGVALALTVALLLDAPLGRPAAVQPLVFVDASQSMAREGSNLMRVALDSARAAGGDSVLLFGDSVRLGRESGRADDAATRVRPIVERAMATGRPAIVITDGELQDSSALDAFTSGSRIVVVARPQRRDVAVAALEVPRAAVDGDSIVARVSIIAGALGANAGTLNLLVGDQAIGRAPVDAMSPWSERQTEVRARLSGAGQGATLVRAVVSTPEDAEPRNDTLSAALEISRAASAVFVSTSPDQDARFAIAVLRGALSLPTRGFYRVAPGTWRVEGTLAPVAESEVRNALREAPVAILHGDTAIFGPPQGATNGPLALLVQPETEDGEWYPSGAPASPLSGVLAAVPFDTLPPVAAGAPAQGDWVGLEARRGREMMRRPVVVGRDAPRRVVTVTASGFWRWRFRGGASADAYAALLGGIFDWLAAERADRRGAVPDEGIIRSGQPIRWRRGSSADSLVRVGLRRRGDSRVDSLLLRFAPGTTIQESAPLQAGVYEVSVPGGQALLPVNASSELLPERPRLSSSAVGRRSNLADARGARGNGWLYALAIALLCAEWLLRRRMGLR
jgi:hypothetical protein